MWRDANRRNWGISCFILGVISILIIIYKTTLLQDLIYLYLLTMFWCFVWALSGAGIFLIITRDNVHYKNNNPQHLLLAFGFSCFVSAICAFIVFLKTELNPNLAYASSALTALVLGFTGETLFILMRKVGMGFLIKE